MHPFGRVPVCSYASTRCRHCRRKARRLTELEFFQSFVEVPDGADAGLSRLAGQRNQLGGGRVAALAKVGLGSKFDAYPSQLFDRPSTPELAQSIGMVGAR